MVRQIKWILSLAGQIKKKNLSSHWLQFHQLFRGNKTPTQSLAKSHICLNSEVKPINLSTQNKNDGTSKSLFFAKNSKAITAGETRVKYEKVGGQKVLPQVACVHKRRGKKCFPFLKLGAVRLVMETNQCSATTIRTGDAHVHCSMFALSSVGLTAG
jgi:hypothetical protein